MTESPNLTIRMSPTDRQEIAAAAEKAGEPSLSDFVLKSCKMRIAGACTTCGRDVGPGVTPPPAFLPLFETWYQRAQGGAHYVALATEEDGERRVYFGHFGNRPLRDSHVTVDLCERQGSNYIPVDVPRTQILMWECDNPDDLRERLCMWGYTDVTRQVLAQVAVVQSRRRTRGR